MILSNQMHKIIENHDQSVTSSILAERLLDQEGEPTRFDVLYLLVECSHSFLEEFSGTTNLEELDYQEWDMLITTATNYLLGFLEYRTPREVLERVAGRRGDFNLLPK